MHSLNENGDMETHNKSLTARWPELRLRVISASVLITVALVAVLTGGLFFTTLIMLGALLMIREWDFLVLKANFGPKWAWGGIAYVLVPCFCLIWLRNIQLEHNLEAGRYLVLFLFFAVWGTDIGAYFAGRAIGGPKLAPSISPGKTWAGLLGGMVSAGLMGVICSFFTPYPPSAIGAGLIGVALAMIAQAGDLFESWLKRKAGVKDSGVLIPGHGGILDRVDGLIFTVPFYALLVALYGTSA